VQDAIIFAKVVRSVSAEKGTVPMSKPDFIASMIQFADHNLKSSHSEAVEEDEAGMTKRWLSLADPALKVRDDEAGPH
jgi:hypothetical protein